MRRQNWEIVVKCSVVHTTAKQVISHHQKGENSYEMYKNEKCMCKACKTYGNFVVKYVNLHGCFAPNYLFQVEISSLSTCLIASSQSPTQKSNADTKQIKKG